MRTSLTVVIALAGAIIAFAAGSDEAAKGAPLRMLLSEVEAGSMATEQYCALIFADRRFHYEKANRKVGRDRDRKVYEGELAQADWDALAAAVDNKDFTELNIPREAPPIIIENAHTFNISVARGTKFQNMEFLDNKSRKPYESQLKPLMKWWKSFRGSRMQESTVQPDSRCSLDSSHGVFTQ